MAKFGSLICRKSMAMDNWLELCFIHVKLWMNHKLRHKYIVHVLRPQVHQGWSKLGVNWYNWSTLGIILVWTEKAGLSWALLWQQSLTLRLAGPATSLVQSRSRSTPLGWSKLGVNWSTVGIILVWTEEPAFLGLCCGSSLWFSSGLVLQ